MPRDVINTHVKREQTHVHIIAETSDLILKHIASIQPLVHANPSTRERSSLVTVGGAERKHAQNQRTHKSMVCLLFLRDPEA